MATNRAKNNATGRSRAVVEQTAFVLHSIPYRETSLVVELFGQQTGRFAVVAKGAKRPRSNLRAVTMMFQPLAVRSSGQSDLQNLTQADWLGGVLLPQGQALISAFYLNELLMRLLHREDPHEGLFEAYHQALFALGNSDSKEAIEVSLRQFEWALLRDSGYAPDIEQDSQGRAIEAANHYFWQQSHGFVRMKVRAQPVESGGAGTSQVVSGQALLDLDQVHFASEKSRMELKHLMRSLLAEQLGAKPLKTRQIFRHLQDFVTES